jgi:2-succinyl-6-hydroxy-2,4-cyclohexadiene-1-carboxylate synthase
LFYDDSGGDGPPVVFMHPAAGSSASWLNQQPAFTASGYRCITCDARGFGKSSRWQDESQAGHASSDLHALADELALERFCLVGAAYGGFGALDFALRFPDRLRAFVLATSQGGLTDPDFVAIRTRIAGPEVRQMPIQFRELGPSYRTESPDGVDRWLHVLEAAGGEHLVRQSPYLSIMLPMLESLRVPTLVLAGDADLLAPPALMRLLAARIPGSEFATVPEAGHSAHWERPEQWNETVLAFLNRHRLVN